MKIYVTGSTGMIGRLVKQKLLLDGHSVFSHPRNIIDLLDEVSVDDGINMVRPEVVVHCAGVVGGVQANIDKPAEFLDENLRMGLNVLQGAMVNEVGTVINVGSACSYPDAILSMGYGLEEEMLWQGKPHETHSPYGLAKRMVVEACEAYSNQYNMDCRTLIMANAYGPGCSFGEDAHVIPSLIRKFVEAKNREFKSVTLWGRGEAKRQFLHASDAASAVSYFLDKPESGPHINIGSNDILDIKTLAGIIADVVGYRGEIGWDDTKPDGQRDRWLDITKAQEFGWEARHVFVDGIKELVKEYKETQCQPLKS